MNDTFNGNALSGDFSLGPRGWPGVKGMAILGPPFCGTVPCNRCIVRK